MDEKTTNNPITVYADLMSQPSRALIWFCKLNNIPHKVDIVQITKQENRTEEYKKRFPFMKVPGIEDNGFFLFESHAILRYLAEKFRVADHWYPKDSKERALVNQYLDWHHSNTRTMAYYTFNKIVAPRVGLKSDPSVISKQEKEIEKSLIGLNNVFLKKTDFISGNQVSLADISAYCEVVGLSLVKYDYSKHSNIIKWMGRMQQLPHYKEVHAVFEKVLKSNM